MAMCREEIFQSGPWPGINTPWPWRIIGNPHDSALAGTKTKEKEATTITKNVYMRSDQAQFKTAGLWINTRLTTIIFWAAFAGCSFRTAKKKNTESACVCNSMVFFLRSLQPTPYSPFIYVLRYISFFLAMLIMVIRRMHEKPFANCAFWNSLSVQTMALPFKNIPVSAVRMCTVCVCVLWICFVRALFRFREFRVDGMQWQLCYSNTATTTKSTTSQKPSNNFSVSFFLLFIHSPSFSFILLLYNRIEMNLRHCSKHGRGNNAFCVCLFICIFRPRH